MTDMPDRRSFLAASGAVLAGSQLQSANQGEIRAAFIGVGVRGGNLLRQTLEQKSVKVAAICDIDPQARDEALSAASRDNPQSITEWRRALDLKDVDAIFIATPCDLHDQMAAAALEAGKYVYCEKPLAITAEGVGRVLRAARQTKTFLQIGQQLRYYPTMREALRKIHEDQILGRSYITKAQRHGGKRRPSGTKREARPRQEKRREWYADVEHSGDLIVENAVHNIDACNWLADSRPVSAYGHGKKYFPEPIPPGAVMMDGFSVEYIYENDMHCDYSQITFHPRTLKALPSGMWYVMFGEKGAVHLTHTSAHFHDLYGESEPVDLLAGKDFSTEEQRRDTAVNDFFQCIRENREPFADIRVGAIAALTAIMGREAIYKGRSVTWKELGVTV